MKTELFNQYAIYWAGGFLVLYVLSQLLVSKHASFQFLSPLQKSVLVKVLAISGLGIAYVIVKFMIS